MPYSGPAKSGIAKLQNTTSRACRIRPGRFICPSLAVAALEVDERRVRSDLQYCGLLFESLAVRDLRAYADPLGGTVFHYRDSNDLEVDTVIEMRNGDRIADHIR